MFFTDLCKILAFRLYGLRVGGYGKLCLRFQDFGLKSLGFKDLGLQSIGPKNSWSRQALGAGLTGCALYVQLRN